MDRIQAELSRVTERLHSFPPLVEFPQLYAVQQALSWALRPDSCRAPFDLIVSRSEAGADCYTATGPEGSGETSDRTDPAGGQPPQLAAGRP